MTEKEIQKFKCPQCENVHKVSVQIIDDQNFILKLEKEPNGTLNCAYLESFSFTYKIGDPKPKDRTHKQTLEFKR